jgi:4-hydroxybenzoate polyprenyltransferase/phosphoserine phosphatase
MELTADKPSAAGTFPVSSWPIVVDLDGTLCRTDTLIESVVGLLKRRPWMMFAVLLWLMRGRAGFKSRVAAAYRLNVQALPWRAELIDWLRQARTRGHRIVLATAAHQQIADDVAAAVPVFDAVLASRAGHNLKGRQKLDAIVSELGQDFVYIGDSTADVPVWAAAREAIVVGHSRRAKARASAAGIAFAQELDSTGPTARTWLKAIRIHQWVKNVLVFVPLLTSFSFTDSARVVHALLAFLAFSLAASGTYLLNDLWDIESDRQHPNKRRRPMASGVLSLPSALLATVVLLAAGSVLGALVSPAFLLVLWGYIVITTFYSLVLKAYVLMDVLALAVLYTYRVVAGGLACGVLLSPWLLAFSVFVFLSLALVKRCSELVTLSQSGIQSTRGRDYRVSDLAILWPMGVGAGLCSVLVYGLFIGSNNAQRAYSDTNVLWVAGIGLIYWLGRMWIKTARGEMHDDPIVFALKDRGSRIAIGAMVLTPLLTHLL